MERKQFVKLEQTDLFLSSFGFVKLDSMSMCFETRNLWVSNGHSVVTPQTLAENYSHGTQRGAQDYGLINGHIVYETDTVLNSNDLFKYNDGLTVCTPDALYSLLQSNVVPRKFPDLIKRLWHYTTEAMAEVKRKKEAARAADMARREEFLDNLGIFNKERRDQIHQYLDKLDRFDWYYSFSDDMSVYRAGRLRENELKAAAKELGMPELFEKAAVLYTYNR